MGCEGQSGRQRDCGETISRRQTANEEKKREGRREGGGMKETSKDKRWNKVTQRHKARKALTGVGLTCAHVNT